MEALWESIAIVLAVSVVSLGLRAGAIVIVSIPLVLAVVFGAMEALGIDLQRISLGALIIALGLLVDDAMITIESMVIRLERGDNKQQAAVFAYASTAYPRLTGTLVTIAGFLPVGFARSDAGEYTFSLFAVVALALSPPGWSPACLHRWSAWRCCALPSIRMARPWARRCACSGAACWRRCGPSGSPSLSRLRCSPQRLPAPASCRSSSFPPPIAPSSWWI